MISSDRDYRFYTSDRYSSSLSAQDNAGIHVDDLEPFEMFNLDTKNSEVDDDYDDDYHYDNDDDGGVPPLTITAPPEDQDRPSIYSTATADLWSRGDFPSGAWVQDQMFGSEPTVSGFGQVLSASNDTLLVGADGNG